MNRLQMNDQPFFSRDEKDLMMENSIKTRLNAGQQLLRLFADFDDASPLIPAPVETISTVRICSRTKIGNELIN